MEVVDTAVPPVWPMPRGERPTAGKRGPGRRSTALPPTMRLMRVRGVTEPPEEPRALAGAAAPRRGLKLRARSRLARRERGLVAVLLLPCALRCISCFLSSDRRGRRDEGDRELGLEEVGGDGARGEMLLPRRPSLCAAGRVTARAARGLRPLEAEEPLDDAEVVLTAGPLLSLFTEAASDTVP